MTSKLNNKPTQLEQKRFGADVKPVNNIKFIKTIQV